MKKKIFLFAFLFFSITLFAQVKKTVPKKPLKDTIASPSKEPVIEEKEIDFGIFSKRPDELSEYIVSESRKYGTKLLKVNDDAIFDFDDKGKQTKEIYEYSKSLNFDSVNVYITSNKNEQIKSIYVYSETVSPKYFNAIKKIFGVDKWSKPSMSDYDTIYRKNNFFASQFFDSYTNNEKKLITSKSLSIRKAGDTNFSNTTQGEFNIDSISVYSKKETIAEQLNNFLNKSGIKFLYNTGNVLEINGHELYGKSISYYYTDGIVITINTNKKDIIKNIFLDVPNPLIYSKIKKNFGLIFWKTSTNEDGNLQYSKNNLKVNTNDNEKSINLKVTPNLTDIAIRYNSASTPSFIQLYNLFNNAGSEDNLHKTITEDYLNSVKFNMKEKTIQFDSTIDKGFFYFSAPNGSIVEVYMVPELRENFTTPFWVNTNDENYLNSLVAEFESSIYAKDYKLSIAKFENTDGFKQFRIFNKNVENRNAEARKQKEEADLAERQRVRAENNAYRALREQQRADQINSATNSIINIINANKKN